MQDFRWLKELWEGKKFLGPQVERATAVIANGTNNIFAVAGGRILVTSLVGQITIVMQGIATLLRLRAVPTTGTARDMCANLDVNAYAVGDILGITGVNTDAMVPPVSSSSIEGQTLPVLVNIGNIALIASIANTGSVRWTLNYLRLDAAASVTAV